MAIDECTLTNVCWNMLVYGECSGQLNWIHFALNDVDLCYYIKYMKKWSLPSIQRNNNRSQQIQPKNKSFLSINKLQGKILLVSFVSECRLTDQLLTTRRVKHDAVFISR